MSELKKCYCDYITSQSFAPKSFPTTAQKPLFIVSFPKWWKTEKFDIILMFSDIWKRMANWPFTLGKTQEKHEVHHMLPCTRKMPMNSLFSWKFFCSFPVCANASFSTCFPTELLTVNVMKTWYLSIIEVFFSSHLVNLTLHWKIDIFN